MAKLLRRHRTHGSAVSFPLGQGPASHLDGPALAQLSACLRQTPNATLDGLRGLAGGSQRAGHEAVRAGAGKRWTGGEKKASTPPSATPNG